MSDQRRKFTATVTATFHFEGEASDPSGAREVLCNRFFMRMMMGYRTKKDMKALEREFVRSSVRFKFEDEPGCSFKAGLFNNKKKGKTK